MNPFATAFYLIPPAIASIISLILLIIVLRHDYRSFANQIFSLLLLTMALWGFFIFCMRASPDATYALRWDKAMAPIAFGMCVFYYHFSLLITRVGKQRNLLRLAYIILALIIVFSPTGFFISRMEVQPYGYAPIFGFGMFLDFGFGYLLLIAAIYNLIKSYRSSTIYEEKNRFLYLALAMAFPLLGGIFEAFPIIYPTSIFGNLIFCILCTVAILKYHLLDIRIVVRKGTAYIVMSALIAIPYVGIILLSTQVFKTQAIPLWVYLLLLIILAFALQPLWSQVQRQVDRWFYRQRYDFLKELEDFSQEVHDIRDLNRLSSALVKLISRALQSSGVYLLLSSSSGDFNTASSVGEETPQLTIGSRSPLLRWLRSHEGILRRTALDTIPQLQTLTTKEANELKKVRAKLFIPLKTKEKELVGMLILSERRSEQPYSGDDERLALSVTSRVAVEYENARLYASEKSMRQELQRQNDQKTEFLHSVAHELKTPLTAIISSSELLSTKISSTTVSQRHRIIQNIVQSARSMDGRVTQLLDFAKMQVEDLKIKSEPLEIGSAIEEIVSRLLILFKNKEQSLKLEIPDSLPQVKVDRGKLEQILVNLLSNANKFSPPGGNIALRVKEEGKRIVVTVKDSAPVIPEVEKTKLFDLYYRGEDADKRQRIPGLGIGLAISKKLVELHQGEIWITSEKRKGNTFAFSLPTYIRE